jgi:hypothetical protein
MPLETKSRPSTAFARKLDLPPPFRLVTLREVGDAFAHAAAVAAQDGAGTLVRVGRFDVAELALVLEPEEPLRIARRAIYIGTCALGDALVANAPPEKAIGFAWPDVIRIDGGLVGGVRLAWPAGADEDEPPAWLVFGAMIRMVAIGEAGLRPLAAALEDVQRSRRRRPGGELRPPSHGCRRHMPGEGIRRSGEELSLASRAGERRAWKARTCETDERRAIRHRRKRRFVDAVRGYARRTKFPDQGARGAVLARSGDRRAPPVRCSYRFELVCEETAE